MPSMPPRRATLPARVPAAPPAEDAPANEDATQDMPDESMLSFGSQAQDRIRTSQEANAFRGYHEFFITKKEMAAAKAKNESQVEVRVHFIRNYANLAENVSVPRCTIIEGGNYRSYTSAGPDCALAAGGCPVSVRPVYLMIDHRSYKKTDGTIVSDSLRLWIPPPTMLGIMQNAIKNLAENLGVEADKLDITKYEAKISKMGEGRNTTWAINFMLQPKGLSKIAQEAIQKAFEEKGYKATLVSWLKPNPKYLISKGGKYVMPRRAGTAGGAGIPSDAGSEEPPF